eukprot:CAMPEP_0184986598 /NCGR_PEP_ID=MMETSP1098-20130426/17278_1 /TAXON_ID=89044 /ORGANISM="Spumella elongata, Strain CCAP 955/1" /LENGTH=450 /DNA_ID=CAMNT_0027510923 /DNA_START=259 /DNA_END=1611 /DNA_ORIENTATION=+
METGSIAKWNLKVGDKFEVGTSLCEVETDKASVSFDATEEGYIAKILVTSGDIKVGDPILVTVEDSASVAAFAGFTASASAAAPAAVAAPAAAAPQAQAVAAPAPVAAAVASAPAGGRVFASPLAKKLAKEAGSSIEAVAAQLKAANSAGSGPNGRIVAEDVLRAATMPKAAASASAPVAQHAAPAAAPKTAAPSSAFAPSSSANGVYADFQLTELAQSLTARQTHAKQVVPHYYLSVELNLAQLLKMRAQFNATAAKAKKGAVELSVQDFLVKAAAGAMQQVPDVNGAWMDTFVRRYEQVDINLVMGAGSFVATPVLRNVAARGLASISAEIASFEDSLFADDESSSALLGDADKMAVGTFSIHNLGMYGVKSAAPIVLTPQACALSLGAIVDTVIPATPSATNDQDWAVAPILTATLSCDHRVVDGAVGAQWLSAFKNLVENPVNLLL